MYSCHSKFSYRKQYKNELSYAKEHGLGIKALKWFTNIQFTAYANLMFHNFFGNHQIVKGVLEKHFKWRKGRCGKRSTKTNFNYQLPNQDDALMSSIPGAKYTE